MMFRPLPSPAVFQFSLLLPLQEENVISYLEPGAEYCVRASFVSFLNRNTLPSEAHCAFTSAPPPKLCRRSLPPPEGSVSETELTSDPPPVQMLKGLLGAFGLLLVLVLLTCVRWVRVRRQQVLPRPERAPPAVCSGFPLST